MTDTTYRTDGFATRRFPGWCVLVYAVENGVRYLERAIFDRDRGSAELRAEIWKARVRGDVG